MKEIKAFIRPTRLYDVIAAVRELVGVPGLTISEVRGFPRFGEKPGERSGGIDLFDSFEMSKVECVVRDDDVSQVVDAIARSAHTGNSGDGKIFVYAVEDVVGIRTRERGENAL